MMTDWFTDLGLIRASTEPPTAAVSLLIFVSVALASLVIVRTLETRKETRRRAIAFNPASGASALPTRTHQALRRSKQESTAVDETTSLLFTAERSLGEANDYSNVRAELVRAGWFGREAVMLYYMARLACGIGCGLAATLLALGWLETANLVQKLALVAGAISAGTMLPQIIVKSRQRKIQLQCERGFPNFLDLLVICAEAGLPPRAAIERVSRDIARSHPYLGANLFLLHLQLRAGSTLSDAIQSMSNRVKVDEVRRLGAVLQQSEVLGANIVQTLRVYADEMRARRMLKAEERAQGLPVKLVMPLAVFVFPVMMLVVFLPIVSRVKPLLN